MFYMYVRMYLQKDKDIFFKDQELSQKDHSLCKKLQDLFEKVGRVFRAQFENLGELVKNTIFVA